VYFQGEEITGVRAHEIAARGIGRTFQLEELFGSLSVLENVMVGCHTRSRSDVLACGFSLPSARSEERRVQDEAMECLKEVGLEQRAHDSISRLPLGERKLVGVARALGMKPRLLMLDEPAGGRAAHEVEKLVHLIYTLRDQGITVFIVEHNMPFVMSLSERVIVLDEGRKIAEGTPDEVRASEEVIKAYLGEEV
jgi:branched-chain amino acid transport system ATP-binding protein